MLAGVAPAGATSVGPGQAHLIMAGDSAHTLFQPDIAGGGRVGRMVELPQGGLGVTTGGTSYYQTYGTPGGSGVAVPTDNNFSTVIGSGGRSGISAMPD